MLSMTNWLFRMSPQFFTGEVDRDELLAANVNGYRVLDRSSAFVGPGKVLAWVGHRDIPQIFSEAMVRGLSVPIADGTTEQVLSNIRINGASYFVWDRDTTDVDAWRSPLLSLAFLRDHTKIVYAADNAYLFELHDDPADRWGFDDSTSLVTIGAAHRGSS